MTLVLTLLCRDEADILESMLRFHFDQGVDQVIATDNGSVDGSLDILKRFERQGRLCLLQEPEHNHDQAIWVTRMARMAAREFNASWVINSDADEFWWPEENNLKNCIPEQIDGLSVQEQFTSTSKAQTAKTPTSHQHAPREELKNQRRTSVTPQSVP